PFLQNYFIPSSMIGGLLALLLGPEVLGAFGLNVFEEGGIFPEAMLDVWATLPDLLISVIFASLFLGQPIPNIKEIWRISGLQITFAHCISWWLYVVGISLTLFVRTRRECKDCGERIMLNKSSHIFTDFWVH